ncbi:DUF4917 family protein [Pelosinus sp. IPA-1]|uniref:DUF4917 family protein n=1 Tax=Pelosinus sp. IPA-1 TaxID=3029569 RepID=UPI0024361CF6|nr:DUF4917 family protein [Pelosinus sp. IPA-1]GMA99994.1 DUF4917 domain-containing protein [Pelosinus sp. IPA-1]
MQDYEIYEFDDLIPNKEVLKSAVLILGNGASIAVSDCFFYSKLFDMACSNSILDCNSRELFEKLDTTDFELVLNKLRQASIINNVLDLDNDNVALKTYDSIRKALINVVKENHVKHGDVLFKLFNIKKFMEQFKTVISLNYDLLIYWAMMSNNFEANYKMKDCFTAKMDDGNLGFDYETQKYRSGYGGVSDPTLVFYPHGSLILATNDNNEELKITVSSQNNLFEEISEKWSKNYVPLFVSEGDSKQKLRTIKRSSYLNYVYENILVDLGKFAVIYGWRLAEQEEHLVNRIFHKNGVSKVMISIYISEKSSVNDIRDEQDRIINLLKRRNKEIEVKFFNASNENCWVNYEG